MSCDAPTFPDHYFVKIDVDGVENYVLVGSIYTFSEKDVSEATLAEIKSKFRAMTYEATPVEPSEDKLPVSQMLYSFQSARGNT